MTLYPAIQNAVLSAIEKPHFSAALPPLSEHAWMKILQSSRHAREENERLEFLGDALMYATLGRELCKQIPNGTPNLYTNVRAALHSNATFSRLAEKLDILAVSRTVLNALTAKTFGDGASAPLKSRPQIKATADLFETVIGAYYLECGFERLCQWVIELYDPLIIAGRKAYETHARNKRKRLVPLASPLQGAKAVKKTRICYSPTKTLTVKSRSPIHKSHHHRLTSPARQYTVLRSSHRLPKINRTLAVSHTPKAPVLSNIKAIPILIDLTLLDDDLSASGSGSSVDEAGRQELVAQSDTTLSGGPSDPRPLRRQSSDDSEVEMQLETMLLSSSSDMDLSSDI